MRHTRNALLLGAMACFASVLGLLAVTPPARAQNADASPAITPALTCAELTALKFPGSTMVITKAEAVPEAPPNTVKPSPFSPALVPVAIPSNCRADGVIDQRMGSDGKPYAIGFAIALPDRWNGRFLFQGGGGLNGSVRPPLGAQATGVVPALARGFVVVSTDSGHKGAVFDASFEKDQEAAVNFAHASVGRVTAVAKAIIARYYAQPPKHSYFAGCSTGGREGMEASQRFANEFDGIVSGDPAMRVGYSGIGLTWAQAAFNKIAPKDADGKPVPSQDFTASDKKLIVDAVLDACDGQDGVKDGMIFNPQQCHFDPAVLACAGAKNDSCLSTQQIGALKEAFGGPKNSRGMQVYPPFPYDSGIAFDTPGAIPGFLPASSPSPLGPPRPILSVDVDAREDAQAGDGLQKLTDTAFWTNLSGFFGHGGKILFFHGMSDPWFTPLDTIDYYQRMAKDNGGLASVRQNQSRLFLVPGMSHCEGGPALDRFDLLGAVVDWVEQGKAPDYVVATGRLFPGRSRPLCAYPQHAQYKGQGDPQDAGNFECKE